MRLRRLISMLPAVVAAAAWLGTAGPAAACSCIETTTADFVGDPTYAIFTGTALPKQDVSVPFVVSEWYQGPAPAAGVLLYTGEMREADGSVMFDTCGRELAPGGWLVFALRQDDGRYDPGSCSLTARLDEPEGQARLAEVRAVLTGIPPPTSEPAAATGSGSAGSWLLVAAPLAIGAAALAIVAFIARRRRA
jgi:hypothetical protein